MTIKTGPCCSIINISVETSARKVLHSMLYMYVISQSFVSLPILVIVLYCTLCRDIIHCQSFIDEGMESDIIHVCDLSIDFQFGNVFYCSVFTMVQGDSLGVLEAIAYDERLTQIDRCTIL
jgi:hypothetical protein